MISSLPVWIDAGTDSLSSRIPLYALDFHTDSRMHACPDSSEVHAVKSAAYAAAGTADNAAGFRREYGNAQWKWEKRFEKRIAVPARSA